MDDPNFSSPYNYGLCETGTSTTLRNDACRSTTADVRATLIASIHWVTVRRPAHPSSYKQTSVSSQNSRDHAGITWKGKYSIYQIKGEIGMFQLFSLIWWLIANLNELWLREISPNFLVALSPTDQQRLKTSSHRLSPLICFLHPLTSAENLCQDDRQLIVLVRQQNRN